MIGPRGALSKRLKPVLSSAVVIGVSTGCSTGCGNGLRRRSSQFRATITQRYFVESAQVYKQSRADNMCSSSTVNHLTAQVAQIFSGWPLYIPAAGLFPQVVSRNERRMSVICKNLCYLCCHRVSKQLNIARRIDQMRADSNVDFNDGNALTTGDEQAGVVRQRTLRAPALVVRLPGVIEHWIEKHDRDVVQWLGSGFDRQAAASERAFLAARGALSDPSAAPRLLTRVEVRGALRRRTWPMLGGAA